MAKTDGVLKLSGKMVEVPMSQELQELQDKQREGRLANRGMQNKNKAAASPSKAKSKSFKKVTNVSMCDVLGHTVRVGDMFLDFSNAQEGEEVELMNMEFVESASPPYTRFVFKAVVGKFGAFDNVTAHQEVFRVLNGTLFVVLD